MYFNLIRFLYAKNISSRVCESPCLCCCGFVLAFFTVYGLNRNCFRVISLLVMPPTAFNSFENDFMKQKVYAATAILTRQLAFRLLFLL